MTKTVKLVVLIFCFLLTGVIKSQAPVVSIDAEKEKKFSPYMYWRHGGIEGLADYKEKHKFQYAQELWYFSESFYIKRNVNKNGVPLNEANIDVSRFESQRKENEEAVLTFEGSTDELVLLPGTKLIYKP